MIPVRRVAHATFETTDLERQVAYYSEVIGLSVLARTPKLAILGTPFGQELIAFERGIACRCTRVAFQVAPGIEQGRLAAVAGQLPHRPAERPLHDLLRGVGVAVDAREREAVERPGAAIEEFLEGRFVSPQHAGHEKPVGVLLRIHLP